MNRTLLASLILSLASTANAGVLYGVTGEKAPNPESLFTLNKTNGAATLSQTLGNGTDGEVLGFNPVDGLMYHWSGSGTKVMETINLNTNALTNITLTGAPAQEFLSATWDGPNNRFLAFYRNAGNSILYSVTTGGVFTALGAPTGSNIKGLAFGGSTLFGVAAFSPTIYTVNPTTGALTGPFTVTSSIGPLYGFNGLATDPDTGLLWAIARNGASSNTSERYLGTIDPSTNVFSSVGILVGKNMANIAFGPGGGVPEPGTSALVALGLGGAILVARRRKVR